MLYPQVEERPADRLQSPRAGVQEGHRREGARVGGVVRSRRSWATVGVSDNVIEASWGALVDAIRLELMRLTEQDENVDKAVEDYCWGV